MKNLLFILILTFTFTSCTPNETDSLDTTDATQADTDQADTDQADTDQADTDQTEQAEADTDDQNSNESTPSQSLSTCLFSLSGNYMGEAKFSIWNFFRRTPYRLEVNSGNNEEGIQEIILLMTLNSNEEASTEKLCTIVSNPDLDMNFTDEEESNPLLGTFTHYNDQSQKRIHRIHVSNDCSLEVLNRDTLSAVIETARSDGNVRSFEALKVDCTSLGTN